MERLSQPQMRRPNFFPGQMVDYRDFNKLAQQADKTVSLLCQYLFDGGGIVVGALGAFQVDPVEGLLVRVRPGIAILPNGQAVCLTEDRLLDLTAHKDAGSDLPLVVSLVDSVVGADRFVDEADPSVQGFRTELTLPEFRFSFGSGTPSGVELFRVLLDPKASALRLATAQEGWASRLPGSVIDLRFRCQIVPQTFLPFSTEEFRQLRGALYSLDSCLRKVARLYLLEDEGHSLEFLAQAHAELLTRPFQPAKVSFLVSEFAERLGVYLGFLSSKLGSRKHQFDERSLLEAVTLLEPLRVRELVPSLPRLGTFKELSGRLEAFVDFALQNYRLVGALEQALLDIRTRQEALGPHIILAGHSFKRVDVSDYEQTVTGKVVVRGSGHQVRTTSALYKEGGAVTAKGLFFKQGEVTVDLQVPHPDRLACLFLRQYVRRAGHSVRYEMNGKAIETDKIAVVDGANSWINRGLVVPSEYLVRGSNQLRITVDKADVDFGFFDCAVYQPQTTSGPESTAEAK